MSAWGGGRSAQSKPTLSLRVVAAVWARPREAALPLCSLPGTCSGACLQRQVDNSVAGRYGSLWPVAAADFTDIGTDDAACTDASWRVALRRDDCHRRPAMR